MIQAEELRIGNITDKGVIKNFWEKGVHIGFGNCYEFTELNPIPLTEERLLKFGFVKHSSNPFWFKKDSLCVSLVGKVELISWDMQIFRIDPEIKSVHQLQNLYFALTNKELSYENEN